MPTDAPGVIALVGRVFVEYGFIYEPSTEVPDLRDFDRHYQAPTGEFFVVREGGLIVGSVGVERLDADTAELHRLYLDAHLRGQGTGRALVNAVLDWCRATPLQHRRRARRARRRRRCPRPHVPDRPGLGPIPAPPNAGSEHGVNPHAEALALGAGATRRPACRDRAGAGQR